MFDKPEGWLSTAHAVLAWGATPPPRISSPRRGRPGRSKAVKSKRNTIRQSKRKNRR